MLSLTCGKRRTLASLDHPNIVPVYDVGSAESFPFFIVSKYIDGSDLAQQMRQRRLPYSQVTLIIAQVADALHYAHTRGFVHRDIKPGNILLERDETPCVADFGLALKDTDVGKGPRYAGTPAYMSPEQARGEGHRVDGRSDIYSLGAVLYELLVGRRVFSSDSEAQLLHLTAHQEPRPLRQIDDSVPKELERICLKAIARRASDRYTTARDMADDLRHFLAQSPLLADARTSAPPSDLPTGSTRAGSSPSTAQSDSQPLRIVPKGLRAFDAHDADFFLELLPGAPIAKGCPTSCVFGKHAWRSPTLTSRFRSV